MNILFAKVGTTEKALVFCEYHSDIIATQRALQEKYGGRWARINTLEQGEFIYFSDSETYRGFEAGKEKYSPSISEL